jgi:flagellar secretion chaperone FliS
MRNNGYQNYFDNEVLAASPLKLIQMLYGAALDSIAAARRHVRQKDIRARTRAINKAIGIVTELSQCLNHESGGALSRNLAGLYAYVLRLMLEANTKQIEAPLAEAEGLLSTLAEAWNACTPAAPAPEHGFPNSELIHREAYASDASPLAP